MIVAPIGKLVKLTGSDLFQTDIKDKLYIYDGYKSNNKVLNYASSNQSSKSFDQITTGQIMELIFTRYFVFINQI